MCLACVFLMLALCLADLAGISFVRGNPLPESVQAWIAGHPDAVIFGEVQQCAETENSQSIYLKNVYLFNTSDENQSGQEISIENVRVFLKKEKEMISIPAGTVLKLSGRLVRVPETGNPGEFDSRQYCACRHIYYYLQDGEILQMSDSYSPYLQGILDVRECFAEIFRESAGEAAPAFEAMVLGEKSELDTETKMRYQMAGIIHILAISGMHISLLGTGLYRLLKKAGLGLFMSGLLALVLVVQYGMLTGGSVAAMRAVCMVLVSVGAELLGRCYDGMTALALSAILLILNSPANLYSSGFLLSFGAVLGISAGQMFCRIAGTKHKTVNALISSVSVQLVTLPVMLYFYGEVSVVGVFLNLAVLPTVGMVLVSGICGGIVGLFSVKLAEIVLIPGRLLLYLYDWLCEITGRFSWSTWIGGQPKIWQAGIYYGILLAVLLMGKKAAEYRNGRDEYVLFRFLRIVLGCILPICLGISILGWQPLKGIRITCLDVGQGDGIVLETSEGYCFLIDGGSSNKSKLGQYQLLPFLKSRGISRLDGILVSHTDSDHVSGILELLELIDKHLTGIRIDKLILPKWSEEGETYRELVILAQKTGTKVVKGYRGDVMDAGRLKLRILSPGNENAGGTDVNEDGMVLEVQYGEFRALFTGDIGEETEKTLLPYLSDVDFLKVAHHGSRFSTSEVFLEKILPEVGVISSSSTNTYGHPAPETIERLQKTGCQIEYTMKNGAITYWTDGTRYTVSRWKNSTDLVQNQTVGNVKK